MAGHWEICDIDMGSLMAQEGVAVYLAFSSFPLPRYLLLLPLIIVILFFLPPILFLFIIIIIVLSTSSFQQPPSTLILSPPPPPPPVRFPLYHTTASSCHVLPISLSAHGHDSSPQASANLSVCPSLNLALHRPVRSTSSSHSLRLVSYSPRPTYASLFSTISCSSSLFISTLLRFAIYCSFLGRTVVGGVWGAIKACFNKHDKG
ncbi:unnamed protein product [Protopolystoma xenopodis]|uniref:Uncharacterized protein n=1 Tax=Protopolystoma xenopodis TaxID=117903 RepID=A0A448WW63_9PLAT|nr:unnamed protein product [Protopolystoma xenopodis]